MTQTVTVRGMVGEIHREVLGGELHPARARELLMRLSALTSNVLEEIKLADAAYAIVLLAWLDTEKKANRARILAETSGEYQRKQEARNTREVVQEMGRALKYYLRSQEEEARLSR